MYLKNVDLQNVETFLNSVFSHKGHSVEVYEDPECQKPLGVFNTKKSLKSLMTLAGVYNIDYCELFDCLHNNYRAWYCRDVDDLVFFKDFSGATGFKSYASNGNFHINVVSPNSGFSYESMLDYIKKYKPDYNREYIIGIPGWVSNEQFGVGASYMEYFSKFGSVLVLNPKTDLSKIKLNLLVLPGGADITPHQHPNSELSFYTGASNPMLEYFDNKWLMHFIKNRTPIFAICRGAQKLFSMFGGKLIQHNYTHPQSTHKKDEAHSVYLHLFDETIKVTSRHHQIMSYTPSKNFIFPDSNLYIEYVGFHKSDKDIVDYSIVEIFRLNNIITGVQYHPEDNTTDTFTPNEIKRLLQNSSVNI